LDTFPGLFCDIIQENCFLDNDFIILDSIWHSTKVLLLIHLPTGKVERLRWSWVNDTFHSKFPPHLLSVTFYSARDSRIIAAISAPNLPHTLVSGEVSKDTATVTWKEVRRAQIPQDIPLQELKWEVVTLGTFPEIFQYVFLAPQKEIPPLLIYPHGGPHSVFTTEYVPAIAYLSLLGYSVILVNYRGSIGFGRTLIDALKGKIGQQDLRDCLDCMDDALRNGKADPNFLGVVGGSHGGFLGLHLLAADKRFKAAILRNPVSNIATMSGITDIPDWCISETGAKDIGDVSTMIQASPFIHINDIKVPTMFLLGENDRRVPNSQAFQVYYSMKERGIPTCIKMYPKNGHAIIKPESEADAWVNAGEWLLKYLSK